jgi:hypothetical protein
MGDLPRERRELPDDENGTGPLASSPRDIPEGKDVAMMIVLVETAAGGVSVAPADIAALAGLGVTNVSLAGDSRTVGIVLDGWAFDPSRAGNEAVAAVAGSAAAQVRALRPLMHVALSLGALATTPPASQRELRKHRRGGIGLDQFSGLGQ